MTEFKLGYRNLKRDINIYILLIISSAIFIALIIGFQSTITTGDLGEMLAKDDLTSTRYFFKIVLWLIAGIQSILLLFFFNGYYRFINKIRVRELTLYKVIGYSRKSVRKVILSEGIIVYAVISLFSIVFAFAFNKGIITYINYQVELPTKLSSTLSVSAIVYSLLLLLILCLYNTYRTYRKAIKVDVDIALSDAAVQKKNTRNSRIYITTTFCLGIILLLNMSYLSTQVTHSINLGIVIIAIFYAYGLFLVINAITKGYQYLIQTNYKNTNFNLLLVSEVNFHLNKSKLVIFSSVIFMMMSIGALLLSQIMTDMMESTIGDYDYKTWESVTVGPDTYDGEWSPVEVDGTILSLNIYPIERNQQELKNLGLDLNANTLVLSREVAKDENLKNGDIASYSEDGEKIEFSTVILDNDENISYAKAFMPESDILSYDCFNSYQVFYKRLEILEREVAAGNVESVNIETIPYFYDILGYGTSTTSLSSYNQYLKMIGEKTISLEGDEVWIDGIIEEGMEKVNIKGHSNTGIDMPIVSDEVYDKEMQKLGGSDIGYEAFNDNTYYKVVKKSEFARIDEEIRNVNNHLFAMLEVNSMQRADVLGTSIFILLIAFYIAIIFIVCNFTLLAINLLSHGIENKQVYYKLTEMGISKHQKKQYTSTFIRSFYLIPLVIGLISGLIATNFAMHILSLYRVYTFTNSKLVIYILILYIVIYVVFISITKYIYNRIVS